MKILGQQPIYQNINTNSVNDTVPSEDDGYNPFELQSIGNTVRPLLGAYSGYNIAKDLNTFKTKPKIQEPSVIEATDLSNPEVLLRKTGVNVAVEAGIYGAVGIVKQGYGLATGKQDWAGASANVLSDVMNGAFSGLGATAGSALAAKTLTAFKVNSTFNLVTVVVGGIIGAKGFSDLFAATGIREGLVDAFGSEKKW